jgi:uncharacterized protein YegL
MSVLPGGPVSSRPLHFIWILDTSGSMTGEKIQSLNYAIRESVPSLRKTARENPNAEVLVRAVTFSTGARWHVATPTPVADFTWDEVTAGGVTDMGAALALVAEQIKIPPMTERALPPVLILVSDGWPTDNFGEGLKKLLAEPWGRKSIRLAISVGRDAERDVLAAFMGSTGLVPLEANNSGMLADYVRWASTAVIKSASAPANDPSSPLGETGSTPPPAPRAQPDIDKLVW